MENDQQPVKADETDNDLERQKVLTRRDFLAGLRKWSAAVIGVAVAGELLKPESVQAGWINSRGTWVNGGGGGWVNRGGSWLNGRGGGAGWVNRSGGGGSWVNRRGW